MGIGVVRDWDLKLEEVKASYTLGGAWESFKVNADLKFVYYSKCQF